MEGFGPASGSVVGDRQALRERTSQVDGALGSLEGSRGALGNRVGHGKTGLRDVRAYTQGGRDGLERLVGKGAIVRRGEGAASMGSSDTGGESLWTLEVPTGG